MNTRPRHIKLENDKYLFFELKKHIHEKMDTLPVSRVNQLKIKLFLYPLVYFGVYIFAQFRADNIALYYVLFSLMGFIVVVIFCELIHELSHNNVFRKSSNNRYALMLFDLLGANSYIWQQRHLKLHHHFPNVNGWDADIDQKGPLCIFPNEKNKSFQKHQHFYVFLLYPLFMLNWLFIRDFRDFFSKDRTVRKVAKIPWVEYCKLFFFKAIYILIIVIIPMTLTDISVVQAIGGLLFLTISGSILAMIVLLTPHVNSSNEFPQLDLNDNINTTWFRHQLISTNDIDNSNWFTRNFLGNFNFHVAHHLFPNISCVYAPEITQVLKSFCKNNNLPYRSYPMSVAFKKHYELIKKNAFAPLEEDL
jgi:linoleoyl-CoA desaturase